MDDQNQTTARPIQDEQTLLRLARRYAWLNHFLSLGLDLTWFGQAVQIVRPVAGGDLLDVSPSNLNMALALARDNPRRRVIRYKLQELPGRLVRQRKIPVRFGGRLALKEGSLADLEPATYAVVSVAFALGQAKDLRETLTGLAGALKPGGIFVALELTVPTTAIIRRIYRIYLKSMAPQVGRWWGLEHYYRDLYQSINTFPKTPTLLGLMAQAGLSRVETMPLALGAATIFRGVKG